MVFRGLLIVVVLSLLTACGQTPRTYLNERGQTTEKKPTTNAGVCNEHQYIVKRNDSISLIAQRCGVDMYELARLNEIHAPFILYPGQELTLPERGQAKAVAKKVDWIWPVKNYEKYQYVKGTSGVNGLEIFSEKGTLIHAVDAGEVVFADNSVSNFGLMVIIRHSNEYLTVYAHNQTLQVKEGQQVEKGEVIANLGDTGQAARPKLYFEARHRGRKMNVDLLINPPQ